MMRARRKGARLIRIAWSRGIADSWTFARSVLRMFDIPTPFRDRTVELAVPADAKAFRKVRHRFCLANTPEGGKRHRSALMPTI
jgi:hypothetical protein